MKNFTTLEKDVTKHSIEFSDLSDESKEILYKQCEAAESKDRNITGAGFFVDFNIPDNAPRLSEKKNCHLNSVSAEINGVQNAVGFILFIKGGLIQHLEGFTQTLPQWSPYEGEPYKLMRIVWTETSPTSKTGTPVDIEASA